MNAWFHSRPLARRFGLPALLAALLALTGCASLDELPPSKGDFSPVMPLAQEAPRVATGGIYRPGTGDILLGRSRRFDVGDVITVVLREAAQGGRSASSNVSRNASNDVVPPGLVGKVSGVSKLLNGVRLDGGKISSEGEGSADQSATLNGEVTVTVAEVLANGNLVVRGEKQMTLSQGSEIIQVSGVIRPEDVGPNNTVQSRRLANARFTYQGSGAIANAARPGWGTRSLLQFWPF